MALSKIDTPALVADAVDNTILDVADNFAFSGTVTGAGVSGKVLQVVNMITSSNTSTNSTSYQDTGMLLSITPSSTTSKIYAIATFGTLSTTASNVGTGNQKIRMYRTISGSSEVYLVQAAVGTREANGFNDYVEGASSISVIDSPSTTNSCSYRIKIKSNHTSTNIQVPAGEHGVLTLMEIAG
jgi:hypothetical protein